MFKPFLPHGFVPTTSCKSHKDRLRIKAIAALAAGWSDYDLSQHLHMPISLFRLYLLTPACLNSPKRRLRRVETGAQGIVCWRIKRFVLFSSPTALVMADTPSGGTATDWDKPDMGLFDRM
jgi:hypothetical protein